MPFSRPDKPNQSALLFTLFSQHANSASNAAELTSLILHGAAAALGRGVGKPPLTSGRISPGDSVPEVCRKQTIKGSGGLAKGCYAAPAPTGGHRPRAGVQGRQQDFQLPAIELGAYWIREPISDAECGIHPHKTTDPAGAGPVRSLSRLLLAARETEAGKAEADERERGGFWDWSKVARHKDRCPRRIREVQPRVI